MLFMSKEAVSSAGTADGIQSERRISFHVFDRRTSYTAYASHRAHVAEVVPVAWNTSSLWSQVVNEERMRLGHWLGQCFLFPLVL